ncbi:hypothetical protein Pst134EA_011618 [Puccinia striiformis f. sp. tritici]|uniref:hypothetical protein n=1 Tax=Puccinia striiformis f. sp. tritici TaxID=168172 RepID=UPI002008D0EB|nr:hypothetical protein Pst134EA_011618 [Puccinia striiformis f. sp. tritici]KAH9467996.1 hypothetical protein Pst134EA_011618 [Puccinia striiformis f. sp. tritici]
MPPPPMATGSEFTHMASGLDSAQNASSEVPQPCYHCWANILLPGAEGLNSFHQETATAGLPLGGHLKLASAPLSHLTAQLPVEQTASSEGTLASSPDYHSWTDVTSSISGGADFFQQDIAPLFVTSDDYFHFPNVPLSQPLDLTCSWLLPMGDEQGSPDSSATDHTVEQDQIHPEKIVHKYEYNPLRTVEREHDSVDHQLDFAGHSNDIQRETALSSDSEGHKSRGELPDQHKATETALSTVATGDLIHHVGKTVDQEVGNSLPREKTQPAAKEDRIQCPYRNDQGCNRTATLAKAKSLVVHMNAHIYPKRWGCRMCKPQGGDHFLLHSYKWEGDLSTHVRDSGRVYDRSLYSHRKTDVEIVAELTRFVFLCKVCKCMFEQESQVREHFQARHAKPGGRPRTKRYYISRRTPTQIRKDLQNFQAFLKRCTDLNQTIATRRAQVMEKDRPKPSLQSLDSDTRTEATDLD